MTMMAQSKLNVNGVAYICASSENSYEFVGVLVTKEKIQLNLSSRLHSCIPDDAEDIDHHTCCFDGSSQMLDLIVTKVNPNDFDDQFVIPHVMRTGEDNFSLTSKHVEFFTDELLVGDEAESVAVKYVSPKLVNQNILVCIGEMKIKYPIDT